ncbi:centromere protein O [Syngnathus typhle]
MLVLQQENNISVTKLTDMEPATGVLNHLIALETQARIRQVQPRQRTPVEELRARVKALTMERDRLEAEIRVHKDIEKRKMRLNNQCAGAEEAEEEMETEGGENEELLQLMARHIHLKELLYVHHIIGGYDITETRKGKGVCVTLSTAYEGVYLKTYNLELDVKPTLRITRHNVPPFIALGELSERGSLQDDLRGFLDTLSTQLNAFEGRRQQLKLLKELHPSVTVMESNALCSILVLMLSTPKKKTLLCTLNYTDLKRCLPTGVRFDCEDEMLPESPEWKNNSKLLMETPVHKALGTMKTSAYIA